MKGDSDLFKEIQLIKMPPRSQYFWLPPAGKGTPFVESLTSYCVRLSDGHRIPASTLIMYDIAPTLSSNDFTPSQITYHSYKATNAINGTGRTADEWTKVLQKLTKRDDLRCMTLLDFANVFANNNLLRKTRAWCSACFTQQAQQLEENALPIYDMLLWKLQAVKVCAIHKVPLQNICPYCKKENLHIGPTALPGHCTVCQHWLGVEPMQTLPSDDFEKELWIATSIGEALSLTQHNDLRLEKKLVRFTLEDLIRRHTQGNRSSFAKKVGIHPYFLEDYLYRDMMFQLPVLMDICFATETPLLQLLLPASDDYIDKVPTKGKIPKNYDINSIVSKNASTIWIKRVKIMEQIASGKKPSLSIKELAKQFGCNVSALYRRCPEQCKKITKRNIIIQNIKSVAERIRLKFKILGIVDQILGEGHYPSQKRVFKIARLNSEPGREVLDEILQEKGIQKKSFKECHLHQCR